MADQDLFLGQIILVRDSHTLNLFVSDRENWILDSFHYWPSYIQQAFNSRGSILIFIGILITIACFSVHYLKPDLAKI